MEKKGGDTLLTQNPVIKTQSKLNFIKKIYQEREKYPFQREFSFLVLLGLLVRFATGREGKRGRRTQSLGLGRRWTFRLRLGAHPTRPRDARTNHKERLHWTPERSPSLHGPWRKSTATVDLKEYSRRVEHEQDIGGLNVIRREVGERDFSPSLHCFWATVSLKNLSLFQANRRIRRNLQEKESEGIGRVTVFCCLETGF